MKIEEIAGERSGCAYRHPGLQPERQRRSKTGDEQFDAVSLNHGGMQKRRPMAAVP
jgi:hypothetical protein